MMGLRKRTSATEPAAENPRPPSAEPGVDPPIIAALVGPLLTLRATLGSGAEAPDVTATEALSSATAQVVDSEGPHRDGLHALESTWTSRGADATVPALRTTQTQIGDISDRGPAYLSVLADAHATSGYAAKRVEEIIAEFRRDARTILDNATSAPETDAIVVRGAQALRDAIDTVTTARSEMDDHVRKLDDMGPLTITTPSATTTDRIPEQNSPGRSLPDPAEPVPAARQQPMDPALAAQLQLQQQLIAAGVQLATTAITAGVDIGTHLIDKITEVGIHAIDTVAASAIPELVDPGSDANSAANNGDSTDSAKLFDALDRSPDSEPSTGTSAFAPPGHSASGNPPFGNPPFGNALSSAKPDLPQMDAKPPPGGPPPMVDSAPPPPVRPSHPGQPDHAGHPGPAGGMMVPPAPPSAGSDEQHKPRDGQLGVTVPATGTTVVPVLGEFDDDAD